MTAPLIKTVTLARGEQKLIVLLRQMPHDEQAVVGKKLRYGSGAKWTVEEVHSECVYCTTPVDPDVLVCPRCQ